MVVHASPPRSVTAGSEFRTVQASGLRVGTQLKFPIYDAHNVLLLAQGQTINSQFLTHLERRGIVDVQVHKDELPRIFAGQPQGTATSVPDFRQAPPCTVVNATTEMLDSELLRGHVGLPPQGTAFAAQLQQLGAASYDALVREQFVQKQSAAVGKVENVLHALTLGKGLDVKALSAVTDDALNDMAQDSDLFACLGINPFSDQYPARHSMHVCMLAIAIGTRLQLDQPTLKELATGCLIHDAGMLRIDRRVYESPQQLNQVEFLEITKHPVIIFDMMKDMRAVTNRSAFIAYQIHERCDGSGYPRRREGAQIHFLSKVAAVADAYVGLVSPRPYRPALAPYFALQQIIRGVDRNLFDSLAAQSLLRTISLFPLGSCVLLSDGRLARVIRANDMDFARPVVEAWYSDQLGLEPDVVNLAESSLTVVGPIAALEPAALPLCTLDLHQGSPAQQSLDSLMQCDRQLPIDAREQRQHVRRPFPHAVRVLVGDPRLPLSGFEVEAQGGEIWAAGMTFTCPRFLQVPTVTLKLAGPGGEVALVSRIIDRQKRHNTWEYSVEFEKRLN